MARRVRAAIAYSGLTYPDLAKQTGVTEGTLRNMSSKTRPVGQTDERIEALAAACGVPMWLFTRGLAAEPSAGESQLDRIERDLAVLRDLRRDEEKRAREVDDQLEKQTRILEKIEDAVRREVNAATLLDLAREQIARVLPPAAAGPVEAPTEPATSDTQQG